MRKTKIICTLGPAVDTDGMVQALIENGMNCARVNFSHGDHDEQKGRMDRVKRVRKKLGVPLPILLDTKGPEIRLKDFENGSVRVEKGQEFTFSADDTIIGTDKIVGLTYPYLSQNVKPGVRILVDDGKVCMEVTRIEGSNVVCTLINSGKLSNHKSINIPDVVIDMPYISEVDKGDILFGIEQDVDFIAASFVRTADDVIELRKLLDDNGGEKIKIIAKIENTSGVDNLDEIMKYCNGIMVARGDMGVEISFMKLPPIQKMIIGKCREKGLIVITATQMLESMTSNMRPTRAEVSDVANSIYDGTTVIMLSGESAAGDYPIESVRTMAQIAEETEQDINYRHRFNKNSSEELCDDIVKTIAYASASAANGMNAAAIIAMSRGGRTIERLAKYNIECPIIAGVMDNKAVRQMNLEWNVYPVHTHEAYKTDDLISMGINIGVNSGLVKSGDMVVITASSTLGEAKTDTMKLHRV